MPKVFYAAALATVSLNQAVAAEEVQGRLSCVLSGRGTGVVGGGVIGGENVRLLVDTVQKTVSLNQLSGTIGPPSRSEISWNWALVRPTGLTRRPLHREAVIAILTCPEGPGDFEFTCRRTHRRPYQPRRIRMVQP